MRAPIDLVPIGLATGWERAYVGLPFADRGRTRAGVDCYGLVRLVYAEAGVELPPLERAYARAEAAADAASCWTDERRRWLEVDRPEPGDLVLMRIGRWPCHVGLYAAPARVLHARKATGAILQPLADAPPALSFHRFAR